MFLEASKKPCFITHFFWRILAAPKLRLPAARRKRRAEPTRRVAAMFEAEVFAAQRFEHSPFKNDWRLSCRPSGRGKSGPPDSMLTAGWKSGSAVQLGTIRFSLRVVPIRSGR